MDEKVKRKLQVRAALNGRSMEAEVRELLKALAADEKPAPAAVEEDLGTLIHRRFAEYGGVELQIPPRTKSHRPIPTLD